MSSMTHRTPARPAAFLAVLALWACGSEGGGADVARAPARSGDVWEIANPDDRAGAAGAMRAYAAGLHVVVLDGAKAFAGMTRLEGQRGEGGAVTFTLGGGLTATMAPAGDGMELRFSTGERVAMRKRGGDS